MSNPPPKLAGNWAAMSQAGSALTGPVIVGLFLDWQCGTLPWITLAGVVLGLVGSLVLLMTLTLPKTEAAKPRPTEPPVS